MHSTKTESSMGDKAKHAAYIEGWIFGSKRQSQNRDGVIGASISALQDSFFNDRPELQSLPAQRLKEIAKELRRGHDEGAEEVLRNRPWELADY